MKSRGKAEEAGANEESLVLLAGGQFGADVGVSVNFRVVFHRSLGSPSRPRARRSGVQFPCFSAFWADCGPYPSLSAAKKLFRQV